MTEQELKDTAAFYESPTGKKFAGRPGRARRHASQASPAAGASRLSTDMLARVHEEMKKKGKDF